MYSTKTKQTDKKNIIEFFKLKKIECFEYIFFTPFDSFYFLKNV